MNINIWIYCNPFGNPASPGAGLHGSCWRRFLMRREWRKELEALQLALIWLLVVVVVRSSSVSRVWYVCYCCCSVYCHIAGSSCMMILAIVQYDEHKHYHYGCCFNCQGHLCCISCLKLVLGISVNIINIIIAIVIRKS